MKTLKDRFFDFMRKISPKSEEDLIFSEIYKLVDEPKNYGKLSMLYLRLQNGHVAALGRTQDNNYQMLLVKMYGNSYKFYRDLRQKENKKQSILNRINKLKLL